MGHFKIRENFSLHFEQSNDTSTVKNNRQVGKYM